MLEDLIDRVRQDFVESKCPAPVYFGKEYNDENAAPNRVVFWPTADTFGNANPAVIPFNGPGSDLQTLLTIFSGAECHIWAAAPPQADATQQLRADYGVLNALRNQVLLSLIRQAQGIVALTGGDTRQVVIHDRLGLVYVVQFTVQIPVVDIDFPDGAITTDAFTWPLVSGVSADTTVTLVDPSEEDESD